MAVGVVNGEMGFDEYLGMIVAGDVDECGEGKTNVHEMDTLIYSTPHQDVKELTRYLRDLNWMGHGSAYDGNEGRPRKRVSVLGTLRTMGRPFTGSQFHARNEEHKVPSSFRRTEHAQRTNSPTVVRKQH